MTEADEARVRELAEDMQAASKTILAILAESKPSQ